MKFHSFSPNFRKAVILQSLRNVEVTQVQVNDNILTVVSTKVKCNTYFTAWFMLPQAEIVNKNVASAELIKSFNIIHVHMQGLFSTCYIIVSAFSTLKNILDWFKILKLENWSKFCYCWKIWVVSIYII